MYIFCENKIYDKIKNLSFAPETDITGDTIPINQFEVDIITTDNIPHGTWAYLYSGEDIWALYWVSFAEHIDRHTVHIKAVSMLSFLDQRTLPAVMYDTGITDVLNDIFQDIPYVVDESLASVIYTEEGGVVEEVIVQGFCPEQSARERLLWVCLTVGAYVKTFFNTQVELMCLTDTTVAVPADRTFWKPSQTFRDYVTAVKVIYYEYTLGTPETTDEWVTDGTDYYVQTEHTFTLTNSGAPESAQENVVTVEGVTIINEDNVSDIASFLSNYYFNRVEVDMDVINNGDLMPGMKVVAYKDVDDPFTGYIQSCDFAFGLQSRSSLHILGVAAVTGATLVIIYKYGDIQLNRRSFNLPVGYVYSISNPFIDWSMNQHRYIFIANNENATGTVASGGSTNIQQYGIALDLSTADRTLSIYSVDELELVTEEDTEIDPDTEEEVTVEYNVLEIS